MTEPATQETSLSKPPRRGRPAQLAIKAVAWITLCMIAGPFMQEFTFWGYAALMVGGTAAVIVQHFIGWPRPRWKSPSGPEGFAVEADPAAQDLFCIDCGYDLQQLNSDRCPECGWLIDRNILTRTRLPWVYRKELGRWRAYWRTVLFASRNVKQLSMEIVRPVDAPDARRFATVTALIATVPIAAAIVAAVLFADGASVLNSLPFPPAADATLPLAAGLALWPVPALAMLLCGWLITHAAAIWFGPAGPQPTRAQRSAALSYYICAPLAAIPLAAAACFGAVGMDAANLRHGQLAGFYNILLFGGISIAILCFALTWSNAILLLRRTMRPPGLRLLFVAIAIPVTWTLCAALAFGVVPWIVGFVYLMFDSLR